MTRRLRRCGRVSALSRQLAIGATLPRRDKLDQPGVNDMTTPTPIATFEDILAAMEQHPRLQREVNAGDFRFSSFGWPCQSSIGGW